MAIEKSAERLCQGPRRKFINKRDLVATHLRGQSKSTVGSANKSVFDIMCEMLEKRKEEARSDERAWIIVDLLFGEGTGEAIRQMAR